MERLLKEGLLAAELQERDLGALPANEKRKVAFARAVWRRTTVSQVWVAERLKMRHAANVSLAFHRDQGGVKALPAALQEFVKVQENAH